MLAAATLAAAMAQRRRRRRQRDEPERSATCRSPQPGILMFADPKTAARAGGVGAKCRTTRLSQGYRLAGESCDGFVAVENHMNILERKFLLAQTAFQRARAANAGTKSRLER